MCAEMPAQMYKGTLNFAARRCVLFDFDGTLVDTGPGILKCMRHALEKNGVPAGDDRSLHRFVGPPFVQALREFCGVEGERADRIIRDYRAMYAKDGLYDCAPYPGALDCVQALSAAGKRTAVATSKPIWFARELLDKFGFTPYFSFVSGARSDAHAGKAEIVRLKVERDKLAGKAAKDDDASVQEEPEKESRYKDMIEEFPEDIFTGAVEDVDLSDESDS